MAQLRAETTIQAPVQQVFDFLVTPQKIPLVMPSLVENYNIPELPLKEGHRFNFRYQLYGVMLEGTWTVTKLEPPRRYEARTTGSVPGGAESEWKYELTERPAGTHVALTIDYQPPQSVLQRVQLGILESINKKEAETYMHHLKLALELQGE